MMMTTTTTTSIKLWNMTTRVKMIQIVIYIMLNISQKYLPLPQPTYKGNKI